MESFLKDYSENENSSFLFFFLYVLFMRTNCHHHKSGHFFLLKLCNLLDKFKYTLDAEPPNSETRKQS